MKNTLFFVFIGLCVWSCEEKKEISNTPVKELAAKEISVEDKILRYIENKLSINSAEEYTYQFYYDNLTKDTVQDIVITVQREAFAIDKYTKAGKQKVIEKLGYNVPFNYVFFQNGANGNIYTASPIGASVNIPMEVSFVSLISPSKKDLIIDYRITNGGFRAYYTVVDDRLVEVLNHPMFDGVGKEDVKFYATTYSKGTFSLAKDVNIFKAIDKNYKADEIDNIFNYHPELERTNEIYLRFMYDPKREKYVTPGEGK